MATENDMSWIGTASHALGGPKYPWQEWQRATDLSRDGRYRSDQDFGPGDSRADMPDEYGATEKRIQALMRELGKKDGADRTMQRDEGNKFNDLQARTKMVEALERAVEEKNGAPAVGSGRDRIGELAGPDGPMRESLVPGFVPGGEERLDWEPRRPKGENVGDRNRRLASEKKSEPDKKAKYKNERITHKGFLTPEQREEAKNKLAEGVMGGRDTSTEGTRKNYLLGNAFGKAITGTWGAYGMKGMSQINDNIMENERLAMDEFERPERIRKERMAELLKGIGDDSELGRLFRDRQDESVSIDGQMQDPSVVARRPQLQMQSDSEAIGAADPEMGDLVSRGMASDKMSASIKDGLSNDKTRAQIVELEAKAAYQRARAAGVDDADAKILADRIKQQALEKLEELKDGWGWWDKEVDPKDRPLGLNEHNLPDDDLLMALAREQLAGQGK